MKAQEKANHSKIHFHCKHIKISLYLHAQRSPALGISCAQGTVKQLCLGYLCSSSIAPIRKKPLLRQSDSKSLHQAMKPLRHVRKNSRHKTLPVIGSLFVVGGKPRLAAYADNCVALRWNDAGEKKNDHHCPRLRSWY
jgi:hypothetical protein